MDDAQNRRCRVIEYEAFRGDAGFDEEKLAAMVSGCANRQEFSELT
jgi:hypothetical protein